MESQLDKLKDAEAQLHELFEKGFDTEYKETSRKILGLVKDPIKDRRGLYHRWKELSPVNKALLEGIAGDISAMIAVLAAMQEFATAWNLPDGVDPGRCVESARAARAHGIPLKGLAFLKAEFQYNINIMLCHGEYEQLC